MWNKGSTLIEAVFAFSIYIIIIVMFVSLMTVLNNSSVKLTEYRDRKSAEELELTSEGGEPIWIIKEVLP